MSAKPPTIVIDPAEFQQELCDAHVRGYQEAKDGRPCSVMRRLAESDTPPQSKRASAAPALTPDPVPSVSVPAQIEVHHSAGESPTQRLPEPGFCACKFSSGGILKRLCQFHTNREAPLRAGLSVLTDRAERAESALARAQMQNDDHLAAIGALQRDIARQVEMGEGAVRDAERWREHAKVMDAAVLPHALHIRFSMREDGQSWGSQTVLDTRKIRHSALDRHKLVGLRAEEMAYKLFAAIDAALLKARSGENKDG